MNLGAGKYRWVIFSPGRKANDFGHAIANAVGEHSPVVLVDDLNSAWRRPWKILLRGRMKNIPGIAHGMFYKIWHTPERFPILSALPRKLNVRRLVQEINRLLPRENRFVVYDRPSQYDLAGKLGERLSIYLVLDDLALTVTGESIEGELGAEKRLLEKVGIVICVSENLAQRIRKRSPLNLQPFVHVLPNGYDPRIFDAQNKWPEPDALQGIPHPRILVAGHISDRIDWRGIEVASRLRPKWAWIFIGPNNGDLRKENSCELGGKGSWHLPVPFDEIPAWIQHCDVCAVPYRLNDFTLASNPLKALEYLAMGMPVLSTRIPSLQCYDHVIEWVEEGNGESYVVALDNLVDQERNHQMRKFRIMAVANDSWDVRVHQFCQIVFDRLKSPADIH